MAGAMGHPRPGADSAWPCPVGAATSHPGRRRRGVCNGHAHRGRPPSLGLPVDAHPRPARAPARGPRPQPRQRGRAAADARRRGRLADRASQLRAARATARRGLRGRAARGLAPDAAPRLRQRGLGPPLAVLGHRGPRRRPHPRSTPTPAARPRPRAGGQPSPDRGAAGPARRRGGLASIRGS